MILAFTIYINACHFNLYLLKLFSGNLSKMDKETPYETFQFIETSESNPTINQVLVLQEDGTLLSKHTLIIDE